MEKKQDFKGISAVVVLGTFLFFGFKGCWEDKKINAAKAEASKQEASNAKANLDKIEKEVSVIIDVKKIAGKSFEEVESVLGKAQKTERVTGFPCENSACQKALFRNGSYEILFKNSKADRITIISAPDMTNEDGAIQALGFPVSSPTFKNAYTVQRWNDVDGISEISFFTDYILIQVTTPG